jgi:3',5'-cyclic AMP phosphodiesterase CpdA
MRLRSVLFNKRVTGYANLLLHRARVFRRDFLETVLAAAARDGDHVVVTGDITNLSLESEYAEAVGLLARIAHTTEVTVVPGNHDLYIPHVQRVGRFNRYLSAFCTSDLPELAQEVPAGRFPFVRLRGPLAIIGLSSAVPRPPFVSAGKLGARQLEALTRILAHPEVVCRTPVVLVHHEPTDSLRLEQLRSGLRDATALRNSLAPVARGFVLFGHLHLRKRSTLHTAAGTLEVVCASGASLDHPSDAIRAGYNVYDVNEDGRIVSIAARVLEPDGLAIRDVAIPH